MRLASIQSTGGIYICAANVNVPETSTYPGIAYSAAGFGLEWTTAADTAYGPWSDLEKADIDYQSICAAWSGSSSDRIVVLHWRASDDRVVVRYSDDSGATWADSPIGGGNTYFTGSVASKVRYINGQFIIVDDTQLLYGDGATFTAKAITGATMLRDVAHNGDDLYVAIEEDFNVWYAENITDTWVTAALPLDFTSLSDQTNFIEYDTIGGRFVASSALVFFWSTDGITWGSEPISAYGETGDVKLPTNMVQDSGGLAWSLFDGGSDYLRNARMSRYNYYFWDIIDFVPLSDIYRASTFSVLDGYTVLLGTREYDEDAGTWTYYPRRIRWSVPATYNDFTGIDGAVGYGTGDLNGEGSLIESRPVNGRIVTFETNRVGAVVPRGDVDDPWDYDVIKEDFRMLSNPITVDDLCYIIATDGLLYATDGIEVTEVGSSFDATKFDDFSEIKPISLDYSRQLNALIIYYFDTSASVNYAYLVSLSGGSVTKINLPRLSDSGSLAEDPRFITAISDSSDQRILVSHHPQTASSDLINTMALATNKQIEGVDKPVYGTSVDDSYWYATLETGEIYLAPEGEKTSLKHIIVRTYSESRGTNTDRPRIIAFIKSIDDSDWHVAGHQDSYSSYFISDAAAFPGNVSDGSVQSDASVSQLWVTHSGATADYTISSTSLPDGINANDCAIFTEAGGVYTQIKSPEIFGTDVIVRDVEDGTSIYVSWNNSPEIVVKSGDFYDSSLGFIRVTGVSGAMSSDGAAPTFDRYLSSGYEDISTHYPSAQIPDGEGETKIGVNKLLDGFKLKLIVVPEYGGAAAPSIVKITGISLGHIPMGRKILQATGE